MGLNILIADDEKEARALLKHFLEKLQPACSIKQAADGMLTIAALESATYDILFLDIQMPGISGIELLKRFAPANLPAIIFTTAFDKHALTAFDYNAVDYLLKPFNEARFKKALDKAMEYIQLKEIKKQQHVLTSISIKKGNKIQLLPVDEVEFFRATDDYISVITASQNYLITTTLHELENQLDPGMFMRIHKSAIVNLKAIKNIETHRSGDCTIYTKSNKEIRASRNYKDNLKSLLNKN